MARDFLPYLNSTIDGQGIEGLVSYGNRLTSYYMAPIFLLILYFLSIYGMSKSEWKLGGSIAWISLTFFILSWIIQTITPMNQIVIFIFLVGLIVGLIMSAIENAKS